MASKPPARWCAIYTRKSSEEGLEQEFNSLDAQREAGAAYVKSQAHEGWRLIETQYDDGGYSGGNLERPALQRLLADIRAGKADAEIVRHIFPRYVELGSVVKLMRELRAIAISRCSFGTICDGSISSRSNLK
jgi:site-specific DNA recombinase